MTPGFVLDGGLSFRASCLLIPGKIDASVLHERRQGVSCGHYSAILQTTTLLMFVSIFWYRSSVTYLSQTFHTVPSFFVISECVW